MELQLGVMVPTSNLKRQRKADLSFKIASKLLDSQKTTKRTFLPYPHTLLPERMKLESCMPTVKARLGD